MVTYALPRDVRNRSGHALGGHLYWGVQYDLPVRPPIYVAWRLLELHIWRWHVGITW